MALSNRKGGSNNQTDHSLPNVKWVSLLSVNYLKSITQIKVVCFLVVLTLTFLIMASYNLLWYNKSPLFTPSPYLLRPTVVSTSAAAAEVSPSDSKLLEKIIGSKLVYEPREVPTEKEVMETSPHIFSVIPRSFLPGIKNPCWYEEISSQLSTNPYSKNLFTLHLNELKIDELRSNFQQHLQRRNGKLFRLRCLPFFYIIGQPKCGTTDIYDRLVMHPEIKIKLKEPHWWNRKRFGYDYFSSTFHVKYPVEDYLDLFDLAAQNIQKEISRNSSGDHRALQFITGDASASTMWDNSVWSYVDTDRADTEPRFLNQDFIHTVQPDAKILVTLRDPVDRLYSDYLFFNKAKSSTEEAVESVQLFQSCLSAQTLRSCVYKPSLLKSMPLRLTLGMYFVFLLDWLTVFQREQILVIRLEDYSANLTVTMKKILDFLSVGPLPEKVEAALIKQPRSNIRLGKDRPLGHMLPSTRDLLTDFYQPFNNKLASVLDNKAFRWSTVPQPQGAEA